MRKHWLSVIFTMCAAIVTMASAAQPPAIAAQGSAKPESPGGYTQHPIVTWEHDQVNPSAAFSPLTSQFLVVWEDHHWGWGYDWDIYGRFVDLAGNPVGDWFGIAWVDDNHRQRPRVSYNSVNDEFLVVYEYAYSATDHDIYARRLASNGALIGDEFVIANSTQTETDPAVTYDPADNQYLVVWQQWTGDVEFGNNDLYGRLLDAGGSMLYSVIPIKTGTTNSESQPTVACVPAVHQYLVMWSDMIGQYPRLKKQWVKPDSTLGDYEQSFTVGANYLPRLTANTRFQEYVYVYEDKTISPTIQYWGYAELINAGAGFGGPIAYPSTHDQTNIDVAYNPAADNYVMVWEDAYSQSDHDIYMLLYDTYSPYYCCLKIGPEAVSSTSAWQGNPTVASSSGPVSLVVWEDGRNSSTYGVDICAAVVWSGKTYMPRVAK